MCVDVHAYLLAPQVCDYLLTPFFHPELQQMGQMHPSEDALAALAAAHAKTQQTLVGSAAGMLLKLCALEITASASGALRGAKVSLSADECKAVLAALKNSDRYTA